MYRLKIFSEESVPLFGPPLPSPPVFTDHQEFRDFLLVKCEKGDECTFWNECKGLVFIVPELFFFWYFAVINGEKATLETPTFAQKRQRTLDMLIRSLYQDLMPDLHKVRPLFFEPLQMPAAFPCERACFLWMPVPLSPFLSRGRSHSRCCTALFHRSPQFASAYCTMTGYYCNADFLRKAPPLFTSLLFFFLTLVPKLVLLLLLLTRRHSNCCNPSARVNL